MAPTPASLMTARNGAAINTALGLEDFVAGTQEDYVAIAVRNAADLPALAELRAGLRARLAASPVGDPAAYTRAVEAVYRDLWRHWCREGKR